MNKSQRHYQKYRQTYLDRFKRRRDECRNFLNEIKSQPCADCGVQYPPYVMDFDHVYGEKAFNIATARRLSDKLLSEVEKCEVVCANCHRVRTQSRIAGVNG